MWTLSELKSNTRKFEGDIWRIVEGQYISSTMKLAGSLEDQEILEDMLEAAKPPYPDEAEGFDYLLATPFRYRPYEQGSRFRRANQPDGAYYASVLRETATAELAFYRRLFFSHSEGIDYPEAGAEHTAFKVGVSTARALDLTASPFAEDARLLDKVDYTATQELADLAREACVDVILSRSVRCPNGGINVTVLSLDAFTSKVPSQRQTWKIYTRADRVIALCEFPNQSLEFLTGDFDDPRLV